MFAILGNARPAWVVKYLLVVEFAKERPAFFKGELVSQIYSVPEAKTKYSFCIKNKKFGVFL